MNSVSPAFTDFRLFCPQINVFPSLLFSLFLACRFYYQCISFFSSPFSLYSCFCDVFFFLSPFMNYSACFVFLLHFTFYRPYRRHPIILYSTLTLFLYISSFSLLLLSCFSFCYIFPVSIFLMLSSSWCTAFHLSPCINYSACCPFLASLRFLSPSSSSFNYSFFFFFFY